MQGSMRCGHVLNVDDEYLSSSQAFIRSLFSGLQANGRSSGRVGGTVRCGHEQVVPDGASHPWLISRTMLIASWPAALSPILSRHGKVCARTPSWSRVSYDSYMVWTALLT